jgi:hypothetical protein
MKPKLEYASKGPYVVEAQTRLNLLMPGVLPPLKADGSYGEKTVARVRQFQASRGLAADGVTGAKTWAALDAGGPASGPLATPAKPPPAPAHLKGLKVHFGSPIRCSCGTVSTPLMGLAQGAVVTVNDCKPFVNVMPFGKCTSPQHPGYVAPVSYDDPFLQGASMSVQASPAPPCVLAIAGAWQGDFGPGNASGGALPIDRTARCPCKYGGVVHFK